MRLIHKNTKQEARLGDIVIDREGEVAHLTSCPLPHKPSSEGKVTVRWMLDKTYSHELYCSVFNLEWIDREDRQDDSAQ